MSGGGIGLIKASKSSAFKEGDVVSGFVPWSSFFVANAASLVRAALRTDCRPHTRSLCHRAARDSQQGCCRFSEVSVKQ